MLVADPVINVINESTVLGAPFWALVGGVCAALIAGGFLLWNENQKREAETSKLDEMQHRGAATAFLHSINKIVLQSLDENESLKKGASEIGACLIDLELNADADVFESGSTLASAAVSLVNLRRGVLSKIKTAELTDIEAKSWPWYEKCRREYINTLRTRYGIAPLPALHADAENQTAQVNMLTYLASPKPPSPG